MLLEDFFGASENGQEMSGESASPRMRSHGAHYRLYAIIIE